MRSAVILGVVAMTGAVSVGCSTYAVPRYGVSAANVRALRTLRGQWINVGPFTATREVAAIDCRAAGPIKTTDGEPYSQYVRGALISELQMAEVYAPTAPVTLTGTVDRLDFNSLSGEWTISLTLSSSNGHHLHVDEKFAFSSSYMGDVACAQTAQAFMPGVQDLIAKLVGSTEFRDLVAAPSPTPGLAPPASGEATPTTI
jgi:hypothetical protein